MMQWGKWGDTKIEFSEDTSRLGYIQWTSKIEYGLSKDKILHVIKIPIQNLSWQKQIYKIRVVQGKSMCPSSVEKTEVVTKEIIKDGWRNERRNSPRPPFWRQYLYNVEATDNIGSEREVKRGRKIRLKKKDEKIWVKKKTRGPTRRPETLLLTLWLFVTVTVVERDLE